MEDRCQVRGIRIVIANYEYLLEKCRSICSNRRVLDYCCGGGDVMGRGKAQGLDLSEWKPSSPAAMQEKWPPKIVWRKMQCLR